MKSKIKIYKFLLSYIVIFFSVFASFFSLPIPVFASTTKASSSPRVFHAPNNSIKPRIINSHAHSFGKVPTSIASSTMTPNTVLPLTYHSGNVLNKPVVYTIFWVPSTLQDGTTSYVSSTYYSLIQQYFSDIGGSGYYNNITQYYDASGGHPSSSVVYNTSTNSILDVSSYGTSTDCSYTANGQSITNCLSQSHIETEISTIANGLSLSNGLNAVYMVYTPKNEGVCETNGACMFRDDCAFHGDFTDTSSGNEYVYGMVPYSGTDLTACGGFTSSPNGDIDADTAINQSSHEHMEANSDPRVSGGWFDSSGNEIGDKCAYNFGSLAFPHTNADILVNGHYYMIQKEWSNFIGSGGSYTGCTLTSSNQPLTQTIYSLKSSGGYLNAYSTSDGSEADASPRWSYSPTNSAISKPSFDSTNGYIYFVDGNYKLEQINAITGTNTGTSFPSSSGTHIGNIYSVNSSYTAPILNSNGTIYVATDNSQGTQGIYAFGKTGGVTWSNKSSVTGIPQLILYAWSNNTLYATDTAGTTIYAFKTQSGSYGVLKWSYTLPTGNVFSSVDMTVSSGTLYFVTYSTGGDTLYALKDNTTSASATWVNTLPAGSINYAPAVDSTGAYLTSYDSTSGKDYLYGYNLTSGANLWSGGALQLNYSSNSKVAISSSILYVVENGVQAIYETGASAGTLDWQTSGGSSYSDPYPVVLNSELFVDGGTSGYVDVYNTGTSNRGNIRFNSIGGSNGFIIPSPNSN